MVRSHPKHWFDFKANMQPSSSSRTFKTDWKRSGYCNFVFLRFVLTELINKNHMFNRWPIFSSQLWIGSYVCWPGVSLSKGFSNKSWPRENVMSWRYSLCSPSTSKAYLMLSTTWAHWLLVFYSDQLRKVRTSTSHSWSTETSPLMTSIL